MFFFSFEYVQSSSFDRLVVVAPAHLYFHRNSFMEFHLHHIQQTPVK